MDTCRSETTTRSVLGRPNLVQHLHLRCLEESVLPLQARRNTRTTKTTNEVKTRFSLLVSLMILVQVSHHVEDKIKLN